MLSFYEVIFIVIRIVMLIVSCNFIILLIFVIT